MLHNKIWLIFFISPLLHLTVHGQVFYGNHGTTPNAIFNVSVNCYCHDCVEEEFIALSQDYMQWGFSVTPNGKLYGVVNAEDIYEINPTNGNSSVVMDFSTNNWTIRGLVCPTNELCYTIDQSNGIKLVELNLVTGAATEIGPLEYNSFLGDLTLLNGDFYYPSRQGFDTYLSRIKLSSGIIDDDVLFDIPDNGFHALTATAQCNTLLSQSFNPDLFALINVMDGDITYISSSLSKFMGLTSSLEFESVNCTVAVDLDCDDSSDATGANYNSPEYTCVTNLGVPVCDHDILFLYDTLIDFITVELGGSIPDGINEYLTLDQSFPGLTISGSGTTSIQIQSDGTSTATNFKNAMRAVRYHNDAFILTLGTRTVFVNGTTLYGTEMDEGIAFVEVAPWPEYELELGDNIIACENENVVLNAFLPNVDYLWSTNSTQHTITVSESGTYSVTISGDEFCPNVDSVDVTFLPEVQISLSYDKAICLGEEATLVLEVDTDFPLTIELLQLPGDTIQLTNVTDDIEISFFISETTTFTILNATAAAPVCLEIEDSEQIFNLLPAYFDTLNVGICGGDSLLIGPNQYAYNPGIYTIYDNTPFGCDSITTYFVELLNSISIQVEQNTCHATDTGLFIQLIDNPFGCDTIIETHVILGELDTTFLTGFTCYSGTEGIFTQTFTSINGCDSIVTSEITLLPPQDTSYEFRTTCNTNEHGVFSTIFQNQSGCDSLVVATVSMGSSDTTLIFTSSCIMAEIGIFESLLQNQFLCDSLIITTVTAGVGDTTFLYRTSCDSTFLGIHQTLWQDNNGCDSLVIETITFADQDSTFLNESTCEPAEAGTFITPLLNQFGCDSIVITQTALMPSHSFAFDYETCLVSDTGTFIIAYQNEFGCDSIINEHYSLLTTDTTLIALITCDPLISGVQEEWFLSQDGCDSLVIITTTYTPIVSEIMILTDFNNYPISCESNQDGAITIDITGNSPFEVLWSTQSTDEELIMLAAGEYVVTITDANGCSATSSIQLEAPPQLEIGFELSEPGCFENNSGTIVILPLGGVPPYLYSIDGISFQSSPEFDQLQNGMYNLYVTDANYCQNTGIVTINQPLQVDVELGENIQINLGDTVSIEAIINVPYDSLSEVIWQGFDTTDCPSCLIQTVSPIITTGFSINVISDDGCMDSDSMIVSVVSDSDIYFPNVFSPNGDGVNDQFIFYAGRNIDWITSFTIYDRWGGVMFSVRDLLPNDPQLFWDGHSDGEVCSSGVYVYQLIAALSNRERLIKSGSITLVR